MENGPPFTCLILLPTCPNKDFSTQLLAHKSPNESMLWKNWSVIVLSPEICKAKYVSQQPIAELLRKWADNHNEEKWQESAGS